MTEDRGQKKEFGSGNAAFDELRRDKVGKAGQRAVDRNWNLEVGMRPSTAQARQSRKKRKVRRYEKESSIAD